MNDRDPGYPWDPAPGREDPEEALRRLLRETVQTLEPSPGTLAHLRDAVPARRRRRRQLLVGTVASVVLLGVGMPLTIRTASTVGDGGGDTIAGDDRGAYPEGVNSGGDGGGTGDDTGATDSGGQTQGPQEHAQDGTGGASQDPGGGGESATDGTEPDPDATGPLSTSCTREQLGDAETVTQEPDAAGQIYGAIRLVNVSDRPCMVHGSGEMAAVPMGDAVTIESDVQVLDQSEGGLATALPDPGETVEQLLLEPGAAYEVRFAYVPEDGSTGGGCVQSGPTDEPTADPTEPSSGTDDPTTGTTTGGGTSDGSGDDPAGEDAGGGSGGDAGGDSGGDDGSGDTDGDAGGDGGGNSGSETGSDSGVALVYTPESGQPPAAEVALPGVCSGTVYRTDALPAETA